MKDRINQTFESINTFYLTFNLNFGELELFKISSWCISINKPQCPALLCHNFLCFVLRAVGINIWLPLGIYGFLCTGLSERKCWDWLFYFEKSVSQPLNLRIYSSIILTGLCRLLYEMGLIHDINTIGHSVTTRWRRVTANEFG